MSNITIYNKFIYIKALTGMQENMHHMATLANYKISRNNTKIFDPDKILEYLANFSHHQSSWHTILFT